LKRSPSTLLFLFQQVLYEIFQNRQLCEQSIHAEVFQSLASQLNNQQSLQLQSIIFSFPTLLSQYHQGAANNGNNNPPSSPSSSTTMPHVLATSPLATAPIHDVLLQRR
jgi:hypothetical protein